MKSAMQIQRRNPPPLELELERVPKFSILDCIRSEVRDVVHKLPRKPGNRLRQEIDAVIRKNLLRERKVRFASARELCEEPEKNALEEIEVTLQVLGNDRHNKLVIENFGLLEERIKRVEQRLSGLIRRIPDLDQTCRPMVKIDPKRVKTNIQEFVNMFNNVFTSTYEVLTKDNTNVNIMDETLSSKNRLKFHLLSHLTEIKSASCGDDRSFSKKCVASSGTKKLESIDGCTPRATRGKLASKGHLNKIETKSETPVIRAVDSLIALRQRFKAQSTRWKQIKITKKIQEAEEKAKKLQPKDLSDTQSGKKEVDSIRSMKKVKESSFSELNLCSSGGEEYGYGNITQDINDIKYIRMNFNGSKECKELDKKIDGKMKKTTNDALKNFSRKAGSITNTRERPTKIPTKFGSSCRTDAQIDVRSLPGRLSGRGNIGSKSPTSVGMARESSKHTRSKYGTNEKLDDWSEHDSPEVLLKNCVDVDGYVSQPVESTDTIISSEKGDTLSKENKYLTEKFLKECFSGDHNDDDKRYNEYSFNIPKKTNMNKNAIIDIDKLSEETSMLDSLIADIEGDLSVMKNLRSLKTAYNTKDESNQEPKVVTNKEKLKFTRPSTSSPSQKRISILQPKERTSKELKKLDKNKPKDSNVPKSIKTRLNNFKKQHEENLERLKKLCKNCESTTVIFNANALLQESVNSFKESKAKSSESSLKSYPTNTSSYSINSTTEGISKTSISRLSELKLNPPKITKPKTYH